MNNEEGKSGMPDSYSTAEWRNTTPVDSLTKRIGVGFDMGDGTVLRIAISLKSAIHLAESIQEFLNSHSLISSGLPSNPGSRPLLNEATWSIVVSEKGVSLMRLHNGMANEVYARVDHARAAIYLAAISQGFEPPRGLRRCDKPVD